jgi:serine/threonine protein kinase
MLEKRRDKILREVIIWAEVIQSPYFVQYKSSWTENNNNDGEMMIEDTGRTSDSESEINESPLSGHILYIQMELCRMTLRDAITKINDELNQCIAKPITPIGAFIASQFINEIVNGVNYLHSSSPLIIHRDLKPENIFITDGRGGNFIKIGDFSIAAFHGNKSDSFIGSISQNIDHTQKQGTYEYMAPEVLKSCSYDEKCDIYSLGCIAMELLCLDKHVDSA